MILLLMWLTISTPFVLASQQEIAKSSKSSSSQSPLTGNEEENSNSNPLGNNTEEKVPKNISSVSEEFLHDQHRSDHLFSLKKQYHKVKNAGTYTAFHGELLVPPPNVA